MKAKKNMLNGIKFAQIATIIIFIFIGPIGYCLAFPWTSDFYFTGTFAPIPIAVTLSSGAQTINHTSVEMYSDSACHVDTAQGFNIGSPPEFTFTTSKTYYLGLSADTYTTQMFGSNASSIYVTVDADGGASGSVCVPVSCSSLTSCAITSAGPFPLTI